MHSFHGTSYTTPLFLSSGIRVLSFISVCLSVLVGLKAARTSSEVHTLSSFFSIHECKECRMSSLDSVRAQVWRMEWIEM